MGNANNNIIFIIIVIIYFILLVNNKHLQEEILAIDYQIGVLNNENDNMENESCNKLQNLFAVREMSYDKLNLIIEVILLFF